MNELITQFEVESGLKAKEVVEELDGFTVTTDDGKYMVYDEVSAKERSCAIIEDLLSDPAELKEFLKKFGTSQFLLDEASADFFEGWEEDELKDAGLSPYDQVTNEDLIDFCEANAIDLTEKAELFDLTKISEFTIESDGFLILTLGGDYEDHGNGIIWFKAI